MSEHYRIDCTCGRRLDPYQILVLYSIDHPALQHAIKKLLRAGRSDKSEADDVAEAIVALRRWQEMEAGR